MRATQLPKAALGIIHAKHLVPDLTISWCSMGSHWALQLFWQHPPSGNTICDTDHTHACGMHTHACGMHTHLHLLTGLWLVLSLLSLYVDLVLTIHLCCCEILLTHAHSSISTVCCIAMYGTCLMHTTPLACWLTVVVIQLHSMCRWQHKLRYCFGGWASMYHTMHVHIHSIVPSTQIQVHYQSKQCIRGQTFTKLVNYIPCCNNEHTLTTAHSTFRFDSNHC